jgi:hypothetical protein
MVAKSINKRPTELMRNVFPYKAKLYHLNIACQMEQISVILDQPVYRVPPRLVSLPFSPCLSVCDGREESQAFF